MGTFFGTYRKSSIKPILGGLNRDGGLIWEECLFNLENTMVSVLHKELEYKVDKLK